VKKFSETLINSTYLIPLFLLLVSFTFITGCSSGVERLNSENVIQVREAIFDLGEDSEHSSIPRLVELYDTTDSKEVRLEIIRALGKMEEEGPVARLVRMLGDMDTDIRIAAAEALGKIGDPKAVPALTGLIADYDVRLVAIWSLGNIGDTGAVEELSRYLNDEDKYVRYQVKRALKKIADAK
jgi:HEAT repeat protein